MAIKDDILESALKSEARPKKQSFYSRMRALQTDNKQTTNEQQSDNKATTEVQTKRQQSNNSPVEANLNWQQSDNQTDNRTINKATTNEQQNDNKEQTKTSFFSLVGLQRAIMIVVYQNCKISRSHTTDPLSLEFISTQVNTDKKTIKTTLQRLEGKGCLIRAGFKNGRGGWSKYKLPDYIYSEMLSIEIENKLAANWQQTGNKLVSKVATEPTTNDSSSSSFFNENKTTTGGSYSEPKLSGDWQSVDIEPLVSFGFTQTHLSQIAQQQKLTIDMVQNSIYAFAFDLNQNDKAKALKTNPVNYFMGILRNGQPYAPPSNYESPQEQALRLYVERQRELEQKRVALENTAIELAFKEWLGTLSEEDKNAILPHFVRNLKTEQPKLAELKNYFMREIWANKRAEIAQSTT